MLFFGFGCGFGDGDGPSLVTSGDIGRAAMSFDIR
jgi:hypothetical protein